MVQRQGFYNTFDNAIDSHSGEELKKGLVPTDWLESPTRKSLNKSQKPQPQIDSRTGKTVFFF